MADLCHRGAFLGFLWFALFFSGFAAGSGSIHDLLRDHGLPAGLLPKSVTSFNLDPESGVLEANLDRPCYAKFDGLVFFNQTVRGNLSYGGLKGLVGLSQEELFLWLPIKEILVADPSSGVILFDIGVAHKRLSLSLFDTPRDCGDGGKKIDGGPLEMIGQATKWKVKIYEVWADGTNPDNARLGVIASVICEISMGLCHCKVFGPL